MALENIVNNLPENVTAAAAIALGGPPTSASNVNGGVMLGTRASYEDDNWVHIVHNGDDVQKVVKVHPFSDAADQDVTADVLAKMEESAEDDEQTVASGRLGHRLIRR